MDSSDVMDSPEMAGRSETLSLPPLLAAILQGRVGARRFDLVLEAATRDVAIQGGAIQGGAIQGGAIRVGATAKPPVLSADGMKE